eukprot:CAMPEP_0197236230 /NCGR_PEP_ID=MMETSP1429-20130617/3417_1 /TAXON_ID=49237 /ORGANISM="Chaetoceros  sp., Strain UNC1202" /LENGTH=293 /DNA_ID=CAMNT_0042694985 /DNA_START=324 /DNA_END=1205 /DNA_ORIENTATION=+
MRLMMWAKPCITLYSLANPIHFHGTSEKPPDLTAKNPEVDSSRRRNVIIGALSTATIFQSIPAFAISSQEAESSYDKYAATYDALDGGSVANSLGIEEARTNMLKAARGRVLEIGVGTGLNLSKYQFASSQNASDGVTSLTLLDISEGMMEEAKVKLRLLNVPDYVDVHFVKGDATAELSTLFGAEGYFDTVVDTFSLCVMGNAGAKRCLEEMKHVVKPETGRILLIENARSSSNALGMYQDLTADLAAKIGGKGCVSNQDVTSFITKTNGLEVIREEEFAAGVFRSFICRRL